MKYILPSLLAFALTSLPAGLWGDDEPTPLPLPDASEPAAAPGTAVILPLTESAAPIPQPSAKHLLEQASAMLARYRSVSAKVRCRANVFDREVIGAGEYVQGPGSSRLMRFDMQMQSGDDTAHLLQVNDGRSLWRRRQFQGDPEVERIDVARALTAALSGGCVVGNEAMMVLGMGGLGRLLESLQKDFEFTNVFRSELGGLPVYGIDGTWKPIVPQSLGLESVAKFQPHIPDRVTVYLGCDDAFLYRVDYGRMDNGAGEGETVLRPVLKLELYEVQFDVPIDDARFHFDPAGQPVVDVTERYIYSRCAIP